MLLPVFESNQRSHSLRSEAGVDTPLFVGNLDLAVIKLQGEIGHLEHSCGSHQSLGLGNSPEQPFCPNTLNPSWRPSFCSGNKVQSAAQPISTPHAKLVEAICVLGDPHFLLDRSEADNEVLGTKTRDAAKDSLIPFLILDIRTKCRRISVNQ